MWNRKFALGAALALFGAGMASPGAWAGVFDIPHFVAPGEFAIGLEPELTLSSGAGLAANLKYTQGLNDLMNVQGIIGTGGGPRRFRLGGNTTFDFFPDIEGQPGIGLATQAIYYRLFDNSTQDTSGQLEVTAIPYIHKAFQGPGGEVEPYFSLPFGMSFNSGRYRTIWQAVIGSMFKSSEHLRYNVEFGMAVKDTESYLSGGIIYYH